MTYKDELQPYLDLFESTIGILKRPDVSTEDYREQIKLLLSSSDFIVAGNTCEPRFLRNILLEVFTCWMHSSMANYKLDYDFLKAESDHEHNGEEVDDEHFPLPKELGQCLMKIYDRDYPEYRRPWGWYDNIDLDEIRLIEEVKNRVMANIADRGWDK